MCVSGCRWQRDEKPRCACQGYCEWLWYWPWPPGWGRQVAGRLAAGKLAGISISRRPFIGLQGRCCKAPGWVLLGTQDPAPPHSVPPSRPRAPASPQPCWEPRPAPRTAPRKPESPWTGPSGFPGHQQVHPRAVSPVCPSLPPCRLQRPQPLSPRPRPPWRPLCSPWNLKAARLIAFGHQVSRRPAST